MPELTPPLPRLALLALLLLLSGCSLTPDARWQILVQEGANQGFQALRFGASPPLAAMARRGPASSDLWVVIEGDGHAWLSPREPSPDPTPLDPTGWRIARQTRAASMLYLTRPCQYLSDEERRACEVSDWTRGRFREAWVTRLDQAIDAEKSRQSARRIVLTGYSGGGVLAALLAARRRDVACLITVAAPLDHAAWTRLHRVSPLSASLNPADYRTALASIPQIHLTGSEDRVTPPALLEDFIAAYPPGAPARVQRLPGQDHALAAPPNLANLADQNVHCALKESCCEKK